MGFFQERGRCDSSEGTSVEGPSAPEAAEWDVCPRNGQERRCREAKAGEDTVSTRGWATLDVRQP